MFRIAFSLCIVLLFRIPDSGFLVLGLPHVVKLRNSMIEKETNVKLLLNFFQIHQPVHMILVSSVHHVPSQNIFCKDLNIVRAIINLNMCRDSKLKLSLLIYIHVKRKLRRQTEEMVYCLVQGLIYKLGLLKSQTLTEGN